MLAPGWQALGQQAPERRAPELSPGRQEPAALVRTPRKTYCLLAAGNHNVGKIHFEPMGVFAGKSSDIENVADGATFGVPNDPTNEGRALLLLQDLGLITLADDAGITATPNDIVDNPKNLQFSEQEAVALPRTLNDVDFAVINGNYAIDAGLALEDAVAQEDANSAVIQDEYANVVVTTPELEDDERIVALVAALQTDDFKDYLVETFGDAVQAAF